jgi:hypothetical protein
MGGQITLRGQCFPPDTTATLNSEAVSVQWESDEVLHVTLPAHAAGWTKLHIVGPGVLGKGRAKAAIYYGADPAVSPPPKPLSGSVRFQSSRYNFTVRTRFRFFQDPADRSLLDREWHLLADPARLARAGLCVQPVGLGAVRFITKLAELPLGSWLSPSGIQLERSSGGVSLSADGHSVVSHELPEAEPHDVDPSEPEAGFRNDWIVWRARDLVQVSSSSQISSVRQALTGRLSKKLYQITRSVRLTHRVAKQPWVSFTGPAYCEITVTPVLKEEGEEVQASQYVLHGFTEQLQTDQSLRFYIPMVGNFSGRSNRPPDPFVLVLKPKQKSLGARISSALLIPLKQIENLSLTPLPDPVTVDWLAVNFPHRALNRVRLCRAALCCACLKPMPFSTSLRCEACQRQTEPPSAFPGIPPTPPQPRVNTPLTAEELTAFVTNAEKLLGSLEQPALATEVQAQNQSTAEATDKPDKKDDEEDAEVQELRSSTSEFDRVRRLSVNRPAADPALLALAHQVRAASHAAAQQSEAQFQATALASHLIFEFEFRPSLSTPDE